MAKKLMCDRCEELGQMGQLKTWGTVTLKAEDGSTIVLKDLCPECLTSVKRLIDPLDPLPKSAPRRDF